MNYEIIITESQQVNIAYKWLSKKYPKLTKDTDGRVFKYFDGDSNEYDEGLVFIHDPNKNFIDVSRNSVVTTLAYMFDLDYSQLLDVIRKWVEEYYGLNPKIIYFFEDIV